MDKRRVFTACVLGVTLLMLGGLSVAAQGNTLDFENPVEIVLTVGGEHRYTFEGGEGDSVSVSMFAEDDALDPVLELYDPAGVLIAFNDDQAHGVVDASFYDVALSGEGTYVLVARSFGNRSGGTYTLIAEREQHASLDMVASIIIGETIDAELFVPEQVDYWVFTGEAASTISISVEAARGTALDPLIELISPDGDVLVYNDDRTDDDTNSLINAAVLPRNGEYRILVRSWGNSSAGEYTIQLVEGALVETEPTTQGDAPPSNASADMGESAPINFSSEMGIGETVTGELPVGMMDIWKFEVLGPIGIGIALQSVDGSMDPYVQLMGPDGLLIAEDDNGLGSDALLRYVALEEPGTYAIFARTLGDAGAGPYTLLLAEAQPTSQE